MQIKIHPLGGAYFIPGTQYHYIDFTLKSPKNKKAARSISAAYNGSFFTVFQGKCQPIAHNHLVYQRQKQLRVNLRPYFQAFDHLQEQLALPKRELSIYCISHSLYQEFVCQRCRQRLAVIL